MSTWKILARQVPSIPKGYRTQTSEHINFMTNVGVKTSTVFVGTITYMAIEEQVAGILLRSLPDMKVFNYWHTLGI